MNRGGYFLLLFSSQDKENVALKKRNRKITLGLLIGLCNRLYCIVSLRFALGPPSATTAMDGWTMDGICVFVNAKVICRGLRKACEVAVARLDAVSVKPQDDQQVS